MDVPSSIRSITELSVYIGTRETRRVDTYLSALFAHTSRSYLQKLLDAGDVSVNGIVVKKNAKVYLKDTIQICWRVEQGKFEAEDLHLHIVYDGP